MHKLKVMLAVLPVFWICNPANAGAMRNGLPECTTDSFVHEAGFAAELIYGDEGGGGGATEMGGTLPPYYEFTPEHRIGSGIFARRKDGLTTGHGSYLPSAWGNDEFLGAEFNQSAAEAPKSVAPPVPVQIPANVTAAQLRMWLTSPPEQSSVSATVSGAATDATGQSANQGAAAMWNNSGF